MPRFFGAFVLVLARTRTAGRSPGSVERGHAQVLAPSMPEWKSVFGKAKNVRCPAPATKKNDSSSDGSFFLVTCARFRFCDAKGRRGELPDGSSDGRRPGASYCPSRGGVASPPKAELVTESCPRYQTGHSTEVDRFL